MGRVDRIRHRLRRLQGHSQTRSLRDALASGKDVILRIDVQGAETIRRPAPEALLIFLTTASEEELVRRLEERKTETAEEK